jgi:2-polyprenyl-3-methyl-5-hydroxy-6-metoxy-1,4-benzoquinol methylase
MCRLKGGPTPLRMEIGLPMMTGSSCRFDIIVDLNVLEHFADDKGELTRAAQLRAADGNCHPSVLHQVSKRLLTAAAIFS